MSAQITVLRNTKFHTSGIQQSIEGAMHNSLRTNVHPASGSHLSIVGHSHLHSHVPILLVVVKTYHHGIRNNHAWCIGLRTEQSQWMSTFNDKCLILSQYFKILLNETILHPVLTDLPRFAISDEFIRIESNVEAEIIVNHHLERFTFNTISFVGIDRLRLEVSLRTISVTVNASTGAKFLHKLRCKRFVQFFGNVAQCIL